MLIFIYPYATYMLHTCALYFTCWSISIKYIRSKRYRASSRYNRALKRKFAYGDDVIAGQQCHVAVGRMCAASDKSAGLGIKRKIVIRPRT